MRVLVDAYPTVRQLREYIVAMYGCVPEWAEPYLAASRSKHRRGRRQAAAKRRSNADSYRSRITKAKRERVYARNGHRCVRCGATEPLSLDHIVPVSKGGTNDEGNLQTMCVPCNGRKGLRMPDQLAA